LNSQINEATSNLQSLFAHIEALQQAEMYAQASPTTSAQNLTAVFAESIPETSAMNASAYPWNPAGPSTSSLYAAGYGGSAGMLVAPGPGNRTRGRSSSMLSTMSRFTQSSDEAGPSNLAGNGKMIWEDAREERHGSSGSGSGGSGPGSVGDPKSPIGNGKAQLHKWL
jgi:ubiquitination network signaling protein AcrB